MSYALGTNGDRPRSPQLTEERRERLRAGAALRREIDEMGILGAPIYGTKQLYRIAYEVAFRPRSETRVTNWSWIIVGIAVGVPALGATIGYKEVRDDAVGAGAGAAAGMLLAGTGFGVFLNILPRT